MLKRCRRCALTKSHRFSDTYCVDCEKRRRDNLDSAPTPTDNIYSSPTPAPYDPPAPSPAIDSGGGSFGGGGASGDF